ncbi:MAG: metal-sensing transcriptional repressor [Patescibacteria group bacterium]|jgi:DNA-binding FrmR family transcriptional regulator|nr:metal-sensing transcriptional repressor [Patescibacteria group bacterium]
MIIDIKRRALHRTKILQGQLNGIKKMIDNEDYCMDIITQTLAIQKSLSSLNKLIVENHLRTHVKEKFTSRQTNRQSDAIDELLQIYELTNVRGK